MTCHSNPTAVHSAPSRAWLLLTGLMGWVGWWGVGSTAFGQSAEPAATNQIQVIEAEGRVEAAHPNWLQWDVARPPHRLLPGDRVRTAERSRAVIRFTPLSTLRLGELTLIEIPGDEERDSGFSLRRGLLYFFHRDKPATLPIRTPAASAVIRGTEFLLQVADNGATTLSVLNGQVDLFNDLGRVTLNNGEEGLVDVGQAPRKSPVLATYRGIQWATYYPGILDVTELEFTPEERVLLQASLEAYQAGNLHRALDQFALPGAAGGVEVRLYHAALLLAVGSTQEAEQEIRRITDSGTANLRQVAISQALGRVIATVNRLPSQPAPAPTLRTEWMAESYALQAEGRLPEARTAARRAAESSRFGFAWVRLAELEFGFGNIREAVEALEVGQQAFPENAQALALRGFLLASRNQIRSAEATFDQAIRRDGALGNAWLGRGLVRIRQNRLREGRDDLQVACTVEPQRAILRSYLGKAFAESEDAKLADHELLLARELDAGDPTAWFYQALIRQQENRINEAIESLEESKRLNQNRQIYRSELLLDQDRAVRGANLAGIYRDNGMTEVAVQEAIQAVENDAVNYSAHLFLANSYGALRDPNQINLRYETPWLNEYLLANLLAPPGAGTLSPYVTQQEYSRLFERDRLGVSSSTDYRSSGEWFQTAAQHGTLGNSAYAAEVAYRRAGGYRPNDDLEQLTTTVRLKQQLSAQDGLYLQASYADSESGDVAPHYDPTQASLGLRVKERQEPILLAGYHHQWAPGRDSLVLVGRLPDRLSVENPQQSTLLLDQSLGPIPDISGVTLEQHYRSELELYTAEVQQLWRQDRHLVIAGARYQTGHFQTENRQEALLFGLLNVELEQSVEPELERVSGYTYYHFRPIEELLLMAGMSLDRLRYPDQFRYAPLADTESQRERILPKAGIVWNPRPGTTLRAAYTKALSGVSLDQSVQLEPSQVAGFIQTFRGLVPEALAGANAAAPLDTAGVSLEQRWETGTYLGLGGQRLSSAFDRKFGIFRWLPGLVADATRETLDYEEWTVRAWINQRVDRDWSVGLRYRLSLAELAESLPDLPTGATGAPPDQALHSTTHQGTAYLLLNHPSGFFSGLEAHWTQQSNRGFTPAQPGEDHWQFDVSAGYRFARRRVQLRLAVLNVTDRDYRMSPLDSGELRVHERTLLTSLRFAF